MRIAVSFILMAFFILQHAFAYQALDFTNPKTSTYSVKDLSNADLNQTTFIERIWTQKNELPVNSLSLMCLASNGYLWITSYDGLIRFDGLKFDIYSSSEYNVIKNNRFVDVLEDVNGDIFFLSELKRLFRLNTQTNKVDQINLNSTDSFAERIFKDKNGNIWIATKNGIWFSKPDKTFEQFNPTVINTSIYSLMVDKWGKVWFQDASNKLARADNIQVQSIPTEFLNTIKTFPSVDDKNRGWIGFNRQIISYNEKSVNIYVIDDLPQSESISAIYKHPTKELLLIGTPNSGFFETSSIIPQKLTKIPIEGKDVLYSKLFYLKELGYLIASKNGLYSVDHNYEPIYTSPNLELRDVIIDSEGSIWLSTNGNGLIQLKLNYFKNVTFGDSKSANNIYPIIEDKNNSTWIGSYGEGVFNITNNTIINYTLGDGIQDRFITTIFERKNGEILFGGISNLVYSIKDNVISNYDLQSGKNQTAFSIFEDSKLNIWIGTSDALYFKKNSTSQINQADVIDIGQNTQVRFIIEAPDSSIWLATRGKGIIQMKNNLPSFIYLAEPLKRSVVRHLLVDPKSKSKDDFVIWATTEGLGINKIHVTNSSIKVDEIRKQNGLLDDTIHNILIDEYDRFWMSTNRGLFYVPRTELETFLANKESQIKITTYFETDGLPNNEFNGGSQQTAFKRKNGALLFANQHGLVEFNPKSIHTNNTPPITLIQSVKSGQTELFTPSSKELKIEPNYNSFEIYFTSLSLKTSQKNTFKYRLRPLDSNWVDIDSKRSISFQNLSSGTYHFEVIGSNNDGVYSLNPAKLSFEIIPLWYQTTWFYLLLFFVLIGTTYTLFRLRIVQLRLRAQSLETIVRDRTSELQKERDFSATKSQEIEDVLESRKQLMLSISQDLKKPLSFIQTPLLHFRNELIEKKSVKYLSIIDEVLNNTDELNTKINHVIDLSKIHEGKFNIQPTNTNFLQQVQLFFNQFKQNNIQIASKINFTPSFDSSWVAIDIFHFQNALSHLISFLLKTLNQTHEINYTVTSNEENVFLSLEINSDKSNQSQFLLSLFNKNGKLVDKNQDFAFTLNYIVELLRSNGIQTKASELDATHCFIQLQLNRINEQIDTSLKAFSTDEHESEQILDDDLPKNTKPIALCVDDFKPFRILIGESLKHDFQILEAENALIALELMKNHVPDIIITDLKMPKMSGMEFISIIRNDSVLSGIPIVLLSAVTEELSQIEALATGADVYITKPFQPNVLKAQIKSLIAFKRRLRTKLFNIEPTPIQHKGKLDSNDKQFIDSLFKSIENNSMNPNFSVEDLAQMLNTDRSVLFRKVKKLIDKSPSSLIQEMRINKAMSLLRSKEGNVSEIAYACGYNSLSYFSQAFKAQVGKSPSEWLSEMVSNKQE